MKKNCFITLLIFLMSCCAGLAWLGSNTGSQGDSTDQPLLEARDIMARVRAQLPKKPLLITGRLLTSARVGRPTPACRVNILLLLGQNPPKTRYTILDLFGEPVERMTISWNPDSAPKIHYEKGEPLATGPVPDLSSSIRNTEITWNDLTLSFLWWTDGKVVGTESRRGRDCVIVEFNRPQASVTTRLWIDNSLSMIIQAEEYNADGERVRRLSIKNIKKIDETWMIKDMEILRYPSKDRTLLRVDDLRSIQSENNDPSMP